MVNLNEIDEMNVVDKDKVESTIKKMPKEEEALLLADLFKNLGDSTRIKILIALSMGELCVQDLAYITNMSSSAVSHQLKTLKAARLISFRKQGKLVYYSLDDRHVDSLLAIGHSHIKEEGND